MDDTTLSRTRKEVSEDVQLFKEEGIKIGLRLNETKYEVVAHGHLQLIGSLEGFSILSSENVNLLGAPLGPGDTLDNALEGQMLRLAHCHQLLKTHHSPRCTYFTSIFS